MNTVLFAYKNVKFECDVLHSFFDYDEMFLAWFDCNQTTDDYFIEYYKNFMLVSKGGLQQLKKKLKDDEGKIWTLSTVSLKIIFEKMGNPVVILSSFLCSDFHDKDKRIKKIIDNYSYQRVLRRLTIFYFEDIKDLLHKSKNTESFFDFTEEQLLYNGTIKKFRDELFKDF